MSNLIWKMYIFMCLEGEALWEDLSEMKYFGFLITENYG